MEIKNNFQWSVRGYEASDRHAVLALLADGVLEHVYPAFFRALAYPDHLGVVLSVSMAGYVLGGSSYLQALLFGGAWAGLLYYCCHEVYQGYLKRRLGAAYPDTEGPESGLWVAEAEVGGRIQVVGVVAVRGKKGDAGGRERADDWMGGVREEEEEGVVEWYGELPLMVVSYGCRRKGLGSLLAQKALDFCKGHGYASLVVDSSSPQTAANGLYQKLGFIQTASHCETHTNRWISKLARVDVLTLEKVI
ncbi:unnamed protein product [Merluccius merluccius]